jgi:hypothetical protein
MPEDGGLIANAGQLVRALGCRRRQDVLDKIEDEVEPLQVHSVRWGPDSFTVGIATHWVDLEFPFSLSDFWEELSRADRDATDDQYERWRDEAFAELAETAEAAGGVVAIQMWQLASACQLFVRAKGRIPIADRRAAQDHLASYGFVASEIPAGKKQWLLLWQESAPIAPKLASKLTVELPPAAPAARKRRVRRPQG